MLHSRIETVHLERNVHQGVPEPERLMQDDKGIESNFERYNENLNSMKNIIMSKRSDQPTPMEIGSMHRRSMTVAVVQLVSKKEDAFSVM